MRYDFVTLARIRRWTWPRMRNPDLLTLSHHDAAAYVAIGINILLYSVNIHVWSQSLFAIAARANFSVLLALIFRTCVSLFAGSYLDVRAQVSDARLHSYLATLESVVF